jgi:hypothetical protein
LKCITLKLSFSVHHRSWIQANNKSHTWDNISVEIMFVIAWFERHPDRPQC